MPSAKRTQRRPARPRPRRFHFRLRSGAGAGSGIDAHLVHGDIQVGRERAFGFEPRAPEPLIAVAVEHCSGLIAGASGMAVFFTSDTHFGHGGALGRFRRPFAGVRAMDEVMIARWNEVVGPKDEVWHLGDFAVRQSCERLAELLDLLAGRKHLLLGNNDGAATATLAGWASVGAYAEVELDGAVLVLCHYPFRTWNRMARGAINLHGHSHGQLKPLTRQVDVGVDAWDFRPVPLDQIRTHLRQRRGRKR